MPQLTGYYTQERIDALAAGYVPAEERIAHIKTHPHKKCVEGDRCACNCPTCSSERWSRSNAKRLQV